jgi:lipid-A-disaccharide synthase
MPLFDDGPERQRQIDAFARLDAIMRIGDETPSMRAAKIVLDHIRTK